MAMDSGCISNVLRKAVSAGRVARRSLAPPPTMEFSSEELSVLLGGVKVELKLKRNEVLERNIS
jgi:hypothetical protein